MFSNAPTANSSASSDIAGSSLTLEFTWKGRSTYWAGQIKAVYLYIDGQHRYTVKIPERDDSENKVVPLPFKKGNSGAEVDQINYLIIKNLDTTRKITLEVGIFNQRQGNTMTRNADGSWEREIRYTREDVQVHLDLSAIQLGKHYQIFMTHNSHRSAPNSSFWSGDGLCATLIEDGLCRSIAPIPVATTPARTPATTTPNSFSTSTNNILDWLNSVSPSAQLERQGFKKNSETSASPSSAAATPASASTPASAATTPATEEIVSRRPGLHM